MTGFESLFGNEDECQEMRDRAFAAEDDLDSLRNGLKEWEEELANLPPGGTSFNGKTSMRIKEILRNARA